jgi:CDP-6-deoxy-D-xylo-4-hexulose-3-dehydrase
MAALKERYGPGEVIVPPLTWVSDIAAVLQTGLTPVFADIDPRTLGLATDQVLAKITPETRAVFVTHILGYNALTTELVAELVRRQIPLIEDVCESHGATFGGAKLGTIGLMSNFSFYYAHHLSTIEGGMVCTNDDALYEIVRMMRAHGLVREAQSDSVKRQYTTDHPDLNPEFIFAFPSYNMRSTEIQAVLGRSALRRLDASNQIRRENLALFLRQLDPEKYFTDFATEGSCNYALTLVLRNPDESLRDRLCAALRAHGVEYRRGTSGGGNQLRQPYLRRLIGDQFTAYPNVEHVHFFGFYIGNYPTLDPTKIQKLCALLNGLS